MNEMVPSAKVRKTGNFNSQNYVKLSFNNIRGFRSVVACKSFHRSNSPHLLALRETNLGDSIDSSYFSVRGYLPLIQKDSVTYLHGLAVFVKEGVLFAQALSLENTEVSYFCF